MTVLISGHEHAAKGSQISNSHLRLLVVHVRTSLDQRVPSCVSRIMRNPVASSRRRGWPNRRPWPCGRRVPDAQESESLIFFVFDLVDRLPWFTAGHSLAAGSSSTATAVTSISTSAPYYIVVGYVRTEQRRRRPLNGFSAHYAACGFRAQRYATEQYQPQMRRA